MAPGKIKGMMDKAKKLILPGAALSKQDYIMVTDLARKINRVKGGGDRGPNGERGAVSFAGKNHWVYENTDISAMVTNLTKKDMKLVKEAVSDALNPVSKK
jgi:hypothetical protein